MSRPPKKSETLEIRLPYPTKQAFMARCRRDGRTASEALRAFIEQQVEPGPRLGAARLRRWAAGLVLAGAAAAVAVPSLARPGPDFQRLDLNRDGAVSAAEFRQLDADRDGRIVAAELRR